MNSLGTILHFLLTMQNLLLTQKFSSSPSSCSLMIWCVVVYLFIVVLVVIKLPYWIFLHPSPFCRLAITFIGGGWFSLLFAGCYVELRGLRSPQHTAGEANFPSGVRFIFITTLTTCCNKILVTHRPFSEYKNYLKKNCSHIDVFLAFLFNVGIGDLGRVHDAKFGAIKPVYGYLNKNQMCGISTLSVWTLDWETKSSEWVDFYSLPFFRSFVGFQNLEYTFPHSKSARM